MLFYPVSSASNMSSASSATRSALPSSLMMMWSTSNVCCGVICVSFLWLLFSSIEVSLILFYCAGVNILIDVFEVVCFKEIV